MRLGAGPGEVKDVEGVAEWQAYLQSLADQGFFQGQLTGSHLHTHLMAKAAAHFRATEAYATHRAAAQKPAERILELAQQPFDPSQVLPHLFIPDRSCSSDPCSTAVSSF
jgi:hypothetical protein